MGLPAPAQTSESTSDVEEADFVASRFRRHRRPFACARFK